jgi:hypothetical protein
MYEDQISLHHSEYVMTRLYVNADINKRSEMISKQNACKIALLRFFCAISKSNWYSVRKDFLRLGQKKKRSIIYTLAFKRNGGSIKYHVTT